MISHLNRNFRNLKSSFGVRRSRTDSAPPSMAPLSFSRFDSVSYASSLYEEFSVINPRYFREGTIVERFRWKQTQSFSVVCGCPILSSLTADFERLLVVDDQIGTVRLLFQRNDIAMARATVASRTGWAFPKPYRWSGSSNLCDIYSRRCMHLHISPLSDAPTFFDVFVTTFARFVCVLGWIIFDFTCDQSSLCDIIFFPASCDVLIVYFVGSNCCFHGLTYPELQLLSFHVVFLLDQYVLAARILWVWQNYISSSESFYCFYVNQYLRLLPVHTRCCFRGYVNKFHP